MIMVVKRFRMYLFALQMFQIPLIWFARLDWLKRNRVAGNAFFWFGMFCGPPLLGICYCWEFYAYVVAQERKITS
jgi:sterol O-acyltransferase